MSNDIISPRLADEAVAYMRQHGLSGPDGWEAAIQACRRADDVVERCREYGEQFIDEDTADAALRFMRTHKYVGPDAFTRALRDMQSGQQ